MRKLPTRSSLKWAPQAATLSNLEKVVITLMTVTDLLQVDPARLILVTQAVHKAVHSYRLVSLRSRLNIIISQATIKLVGIDSFTL